MVKTLLKSVLIVLVLAGVFFFAFQLWESRRAKQVPVATAPEVPKVEATPVPTLAPTVEPTVEPTVAPTVEPTVAPKPFKSKKTITKKGSVLKPKKTVKKPKRPEPTPMDQPTGASEFDTPTSDPLEPLIPDMLPPPEQQAAAKPDAAAQPAEEPPVDEGNLDLDKLFADTQGNAPGGSGPVDVPVEEPPMDFGSEVASLPPPSEGKFDTSQIMKDLPRVGSLSVRDEGGVTIVSFEKDKKIRYKVFKMVNPSRVVVDFRNAANGMESEYPAFSGTRVKRVTTQQFPGKDEVITRVMFFLEGLPKVEASSQGTALTLRLP